MMDATGQITAPALSAVEALDLSLDRGGKTLFERMSWAIKRGSFLAVTGPSGAGKSSLLSCIRGTLEPLHGSFTLGNESPVSTGTVFQHLRLTAELSVLTNVLCGRLGSYPWWKTLFAFKDNDRRSAFEIISELGFAGLAHKPVRNISGGEQQRTAIARVLFQNPDLILADEPTSNLDLKLAEQVLSRFGRLCKDDGRTVISVLHDRDLVERFADFELRIGPENVNGWSFRRIEKE